ncbi:hypothetical protein [Sporosarcina sp. UB5]|uniref:hypothetical protein n=1 Tax=Sporosarcina sp. UB5 TaxID=3047463 RepID=UPI003D792F51
MRTLQDQLIEKGLSRQRTGEIDRKNTRTRVKQSEQLTDRDLRELMGVNRDIYTRRGGAIRRK